MKLIGKHKDYYDHMQSVYGIDDLVVYDRRGCYPIKDNTIDTRLSRLFSTNRLYDDREKKEVRSYMRKTLLDENGNYIKGYYYPKTKTLMEGDVYHFCLEVGYVHYFFEVERYLDENGKLNLDRHLLFSERVGKGERFSDVPMSLSMVNGRNARIGRLTLDNPPIQYKDPILKNTWITKMIDPKDIWDNLYEYISSLNDKEFTDKRTNDEHIESHGFDRKISFRHRK